MFMEKRNTTSWVVAGVGLMATGLGRLVGGRLGAGISGFGLAHIALGLLDMYRPTLRD